MNDDQLKQLTAELPQRFIKTVDGKDWAAYVTTGHVITRLNQIFGFGGWDHEICEHQLKEMPGGKGAFAYAKTRLTVYVRHGPGITSTVTREDMGTCSNTQGSFADAADTALKGAVSDALKRCARTFGCQFGVFKPEPTRQDPQYWADERARAAVEARRDKT